MGTTQANEHVDADRNWDERGNVSGEEDVRELEDKVGHLTKAILLRGVKSRESPRQHHDDSTTTPPQHNQLISCFLPFP